MSQWLTRPPSTPPPPSSYFFKNMMYILHKCVQNVFKAFVISIVIVLSIKIHEENKSSLRLMAYNATVLPYISNEKGFNFRNYILPHFSRSYSNYIFPSLL